MLNLESRVLLDILDTLNAILEDPENYDYATESRNPMSGAVKRSFHKFVKGFGTVSYSENGVYRAR